MANHVSPRPAHGRERGLRFETLEARALLTLAGDQLFPADNPWNQKIASAPVAANSATLVASIGLSGHLHPDFGTVHQGANIGIPYNVVSGTQPKVNVTIDAYPDESDLVPVPIPANAVIEGDPLSSAQNTGDRHLIVFDQDHNFTYELFNVHRPSEEPDGRWHADSEAVWNTAQDSFRTPGYTSADAAGLPILPGLVRPDEVLDQGVINHALRFTVARTDNAYVFPASHQAGVNNSSYPRMGERFRLKQDFDISGFSAANRVILQALKDYGMIVADNGSNWYLGGSPSSRWNDSDLHALTQLVGSNFEAVDLTPRVTALAPSSGATTGGTQVTITGQNFSGAAGKLQVTFGGVAATNVNVLSDTTLVATAPAHAAGQVHVLVSTPYGTSLAAAADQFTYTTSLPPASVVARAVFYNHSKFDGNDPTANAADDGAIATDKVALLPGQTATFANYTSYSRGLNGLLVDVQNLRGTPTANDFVLRFGNDSNPAGWTAAAAFSSISVRHGAGLGGSDRITIVWPDSALTDGWLQVRLKADATTGLPSDDVFYFGNAIAEAGNSSSDAFVDATDELLARHNPRSFQNPAPIDLPYDYNRDGFVDATDQLLARHNVTSFSNSLRLIVAPSAQNSAATDQVLAALRWSVSTMTGNNDLGSPSTDQRPLRARPLG